MMISSARRPKPVRLPPPGSGAGEFRRIALPVLPEAAAAVLPVGDSPVCPPGLLPGALADPFTPHKILNHFDRLRQFVDGQLVFPITVEVDPTNVCNHRCTWCVSEQSHSGESLGLACFQSLMEELGQCEVRSIVLKGGGEPTVHPHFVEMLDAAYEARLSVGLITNGSMPRAGSREKILQRCEWVRISLDAATPQMHRQIHGAGDFAGILQNVAYLTGNARRTMVGLNFVAEARNFHEMARFAQLARSLGAAYVTIRCVFDPARPLSSDLRDAMRQEAVAAKQIEDGRFRVFLGNFTDRYLGASPSDAVAYPRCLGPNLIGIVGGDANVYACCFLRGNPAFSFGNINQQSFGEIWRSGRRQEVMDAVYAGKCNRVCAGGLTTNRYNHYNEILNYLCAEDKAHAEFA